jgi:hypothetical protein
MTMYLSPVNPAPSQQVLAVGTPQQVGYMSSIEIFLLLP